LVDHDPAKTALIAQLKGLKMTHAELRIPKASTMGYSLFVDEYWTVDEYLREAQKKRGDVSE
jgi:hypothetical protein